MPRRLTSRVFPHPLLTLMLTAVWCLLMGTTSAGTVVFGLIIGTIIPIMTVAYWPDRPVMQKPLGMIGYVAVVVWDIIVANIEVALIVLFKRNDRMVPNWVLIPLDLRTPEAIAILAGTITLTPGTITLDVRDGQLLVHALTKDSAEGLLSGEMDRRVAHLEARGAQREERAGLLGGHGA